MSVITKDEDYYNRIREKAKAKNKESQDAKQRLNDEFNRSNESHLEKLLRRNKNENTKIN